jgi:Tol biopolymer transport system component
VKKQLVLVALGLVAVLVAAGSLAHATAGPEPNDIQDSLPGWSSDGSRIAFERTAPSLQHVVTMQPSGKDLSVASQTGVFRGYVPGHASFMLVQQDDTTIVTAGGRFAGPAAEVHGVDATASPDGTRIAYVRGGALYVARLDQVKLGATPVPVPPETAIATEAPPPPTDVRGPVWSPDGSRIAVASGANLLVVQADGSSDPVLVGQGENPSFDPAGTTIAYERTVGGQWQIWTAGADGSNPHELLGGATADYRFPTFSPLAETLAFITDKQHALGGATRYQYALDVRGGVGATAAETKLLDDVHPYSPPAWSPTGASLAVAAGQECRRWGIFIVPAAGGRASRRSNICRFDGTARADTIHGSPYFDLMNGNGGNDRLFGLAGNDKISGEGGNDVISGGAGNDFILGGPGNDVISGGAGNDTIIPGNGADRVDCGAGNDTVEGAGPLDRIAESCEHVRR